MDLEPEKCSYPLNIMDCYKYSQGECLGLFVLLEQIAIDGDGGRGWLIQQTFTSHVSGGWEGKDQGASGSGDG